MRVAVLGGGLQGCCTALALAGRRLGVTLFDKNEALLTKAAIANEGKIHLGYMYAGDPTLSTAKTMLAGALAFGKAGSFVFSVGSCYLHRRRDSQHSAEIVCAYFETVHALDPMFAE